MDPRRLTAFELSQVSTTAPVIVVDLTKLTEIQLFSLWMRGFAVGAEIDRRGLGRV